MAMKRPSTTIYYRANNLFVTNCHVITNFVEVSVFMHTLYHKNHILGLRPSCLVGLLP